MNTACSLPSTQEEFFPWAEQQDAGYEFDGCRPVAIAGWTAGHSRIGVNLTNALDKRLRGGPCEVLRLGAGVETINKAVRYPDVLVTCSNVNGTAHLASDVLVVFEVAGPGSDVVDRITKVREYAVVQSIRRYVITESSGIGLTLLERAAPDQPWQATALTREDSLRMPEIGIEIPVSEIYEGLSFSDEGDAPG